MFTDSHCHLTDEAFAEDLEAVLARAEEFGVTRVVCIASDPDDAKDALSLAQRRDWIWSTAGVHPHAVAQAHPDALERVRDLAAEPRCVALGETGLDYFYDNSPRAEQRRSFVDHLRLAGDLELPVVVHSREADADMTDILREHGPSVRGVLHCFGGPPGMLEVAMEVGWFVSFTGTSTFKRFDRDIVATVPGDRYMIESDAPYLAPVPHRGKRNEPAFVPLVASAIAEIRGEEVDAVAESTWVNAERFYGLGGSEIR